MRKRAFSIIFVLIISSVIMPIFPVFISSDIKLDGKHGEVNDLNTSVLTEINKTVTIIDLPNTPTNWAWAKAQGYCTGLGTQSNPYIISDKFFNTSSETWNCLTIFHSRAHFIVRDCKFKGHSQYAGVQLYNTTNGVISNNFMHPLTGALVWLSNASYNVIRENNASRGYFYGFLIDGTANPTIMNAFSDNLITHNLEAGIQFRGYSELNTISDNIILNNTLGIELGAFSNNNTITGNQIGNSYSIGLLINTLSQFNEIYENCFITNNVDANDNGFINFWDNGVKGNYWDNYTGLDADNDGIGDVPYNITGIAGSQDNFPLMRYAPPSPPHSGIPGYDLFLVLFAGVASIIGIIFVSNKKKSKL
jgi:parallel beta-helix repeat protein